jgi:2-polyprenyl-6-hydroxyphenyl methylase/3-demethylubiquinone-9 3-methyltransferase
MAAANATVRTIWALGDYHRFALSTVWQLGPALVKACNISAGQRVLDVAAGTGNVAIRAAQAGARVVACDVTVENFEAGRRAAQEAGVDLEWVEGDAAALPFPDEEFDVVTSCFGVMFAPDHHAAASELLRVCRPGGAIAVMSFTPEGAGGDFFRLLAPYLPPQPPGALPPLLWGTEDHVRRLLGGANRSIVMSRHHYLETAPGADQYLDLFKSTFGPMVAIYASLAGPAARADLDAAFLRFVSRWNQERSPDASVAIPYEYLLVIARPAPRVTA